MWNIDVDLLYWQAQENGLALAAENRTIYPDFDWDPGFRLGCGYLFKRDSWEVELVFTHFHAHLSEDVKGNLTPFWINPLFFESHGVVNQADVKWRLHFGEFDLIFKNKIRASSQVDFTSYLGTRVACIRQKYRLTYYGGDLFPGGEDLVTTKNKFLGAGLVMGSHCDWILGKGWQLYTAGAASLLYGEFYVHQGEYADVGVKKRLSLHRTFFATAPVIDLTLGISWEKGMWNLHLGWEEHYFFGQNQWVRLVGDQQFTYVSNLGDLSLHGVVFGAAVNF
jgi:hypothetical protein